MKEKFLFLYDKVFDANGNVKPCGRSACVALIEAAMELNLNPTKNYYGDTDPDSTTYGVMNVQNIKALRNIIA